MKNKLQYFIVKSVLRQLVKEGVIDELEASKVMRKAMEKFGEIEASKPSQSLDNITL